MFYVKCVPIPETNEYELTEGIIIEKIKIPSSYRWNGASVPSFLWPIIGSPFEPRFMAPSLVHDYGYEFGVLPRKQLDKIFKKLLLHNKVDEERANAMYAGVRIGGGSHYKAKK
jgi:hypothetical protein